MNGVAYSYHGTDPAVTFSHPWHAEGQDDAGWRVTVGVEGGFSGHALHFNNREDCEGFICWCMLSNVTRCLEEDDVSNAFDLAAALHARYMKGR